MTTSMHGKQACQAGEGRGSDCLSCIIHYSPIPCVLKYGMRMMKEAPAMASSGVYAALSDNVERGDYFMHNLKDVVYGPAADPRHGPPLWDFSAKCVQEKVGAKVPHADTPAVLVMERPGGGKGSSKVAPSPAPGASLM